MDTAPQIERLEVRKVIGYGRESIVYLADGPGGRFAVKVQRSDVADQPGLALKFRREASLAACLEHPALSKVFAVGHSGDQWYIVREFVEGETLAETLRSQGPLDFPSLVALARSVSGALAEVHAHGLIHRDVKPANIIVEPAGGVRLIDFGLATRVDGIGSTAAPIPAASAAVGTLLYAAPEQSGMLRRPVDNRSDLYALGVVLYEAATGEPPFPSDDIAELVRRHAAVTAPSLLDSATHATPALASIVAVLLAKDPDDRYQSADALFEDLSRLDALDGAIAADTLGSGTTSVPGASLGPTAPDISRKRLTLRKSGRRPNHGSGGTKLIGRDAELARLQSQWREAVSGTGGIFIIAGEAGAGKSRLARRIREDVQASGALVATATCEPSESTPYAALGRALSGLADTVAAAPKPQRGLSMERLSTALGPVADVVGSLAPKLHEQLLPHFKRMPGSVRDATAQRNEAEHFHEAVADVLLRLAQSHAAALFCIDDAHWLDDASTRVLALLARRIRDSRLLVLLTSDAKAVPDGVVDPNLEDASQTPGSPFQTRIAQSQSRAIKRITLGPLTVQGTAALVTTVLGGREVAEDLTRHIHVWSAGSPMAARNYLEMLLDLGAIVPWWGRWETAQEPESDASEVLGELELPEDLTQLLLRRVQQLDTETMEVLAAAAVWGMRFGVAQLAAVVEASEDTVRSAITEAARIHLIERIPEVASEERIYTWVHHTALESLLASLEPTRRAVLHQRIAEALDDQQGGLGAHADKYALARHYALGVRSQNPERLYETNLDAAKLAMSRHANDLALSFLRDAESSEVTDGQSSRPELDDMRGEALARTGSYGLALTHFRRALAAHHDPLARASLRARMAEVLVWGRFETGRALAEVKAGLVELGAPIRDGWGGALADSFVKWSLGRLISWTGIGFGGVAADRRARYKVLERLHSVGGLCAYFDVNPRLMTQMIGRSLFHAHRLGRSEELVNNYLNHILYLGVLGRDRSRRKYARRALDLADHLDDATVKAKVGLYVNVSMHLVGDAPRAQTAMQTYLSKNERKLPVWDTLGGCADLGWNLLIRGYSAHAWEYLLRGLQRAGVLGPEPTSTDGGIVRRYPSILWAGTALTVIGRATEGARLLARGIEFAAASTEEERYFKAALASQQLAVALETGQLGETAERAIRDFEAADVGTRLCPFYLRDFFVVQAYVRLEQCEVAAVEDRHWRLKAAKAALKVLKKTATHPSLRAHLAVAWAKYYRLAGSLRKAARWVDKAERRARDNDNRWVRFRAQVERAHLLQNRGATQASLYEAELACATAHEASWTERARRVEHLFGIAERSTLAGASAGLTVQQGSRRRGVATADAVRLQRHLDALLELSLASSMVLHPDQQARVALDEIVRLLNAERAFLFLYSDEEGALELAAGRGDDGQDLSDLTGYASTVVEQVWTNLEPMVVSGSEEGTVIASESVVRRGIRSIIAAPLMIRDRLLGVIYLDSRVARGIFTEDDVQILLAVANHIAIALEAARSAQLEVEYQVERRERRLAEALRKATNLMAGTLDMNQVLMRLLESLEDLVPHHSAAVLMLDGEDYAMVAGRGYEDLESLRDLRIRRGEDALFTEIERTRRPLVISDVRLDPRFRRLGDSAHTRAWIGVPLLSSDDVIGMLTLDNRSPGTYSEYDAEMALTFASQAAIGLDNARLFGEVQRLALLDGLTGVFNRRHFFELAQREYGRAARYGNTLSVVMLDIDDFKRINDRFGHPVGDEVLRVVAARTLAASRDVDVVGRYGGEEFVILLPETPLDEASQGFAERLRKAIGDLPVPTDRGPINVTISVGVAAIGSNHVRGFEGLVDRADQALLRAKKNGKNRIEVGEDD